MALSSRQKRAIEIAVGSKDDDQKAVSKAVAGAAATADVALIATADATDLATAVTLVNACKAKINEIINAHKNA